jgi:hypothetical protein
MAKPWLRRGIAAAALVSASIALAAPAKTVWQPLLAKGTAWTLKRSSEKTDLSAAAMKVTITDVRAVGKAQVAHIDYDCGDDQVCNNALLVRQIAVTAQGVYVLDQDADDAAVAKAVKKPPFAAEPPRPVDPSKRTRGAFALVPKARPGTYCVGQVDVPVDVPNDVPDDGVGCGAAPCAGWLCVDGNGVVGAGDVGADGATFGFVPDRVPR